MCLSQYPVSCKNPGWSDVSPVGRVEMMRRYNYESYLNSKISQRNNVARWWWEYVCVYVCVVLFYSKCCINAVLSLVAGRQGGRPSRCGQRLQRHQRAQVLHVLPVGLLRALLSGKLYTSTSSSWPRWRNSEYELCDIRVMLHGGRFIRVIFVFLRQKIKT